MKGSDLIIQNNIDEIVKGLLLGDGYIHKPFNIDSTGSNTYLGLVNLHPEYIYWMCKIFNQHNIGTNCRIQSERGGFEGSKLSSVLETRTSSYFRELWFEWYEFNNTTQKYGKRIPYNFELTTITPTVLLHWFIGDGYLVHLHEVPTRVQFCTDRYTQEDVYRLINMLNRDIQGLEARYDCTRNRIKIVKSKLNIFYNYLGECPYDIEHSLGYKWN